MNVKLSTLAAIACTVTIPLGVLLAQNAMPGMQHPPVTEMPAKPPAPPATLAYIAANARMHAQMEIKCHGNSDIDFAASMMPHHQGAIEMARIELQYGTDPKIRKLAEEIIKAREPEIEIMRKWLSAKGQ